LDEKEAQAIPGKTIGGLAQLARAPALHAGGQRFDSVILHRFYVLLRFKLNVSTSRKSSLTYWN
jgi:hypothetical protein